MKALVTGATGFVGARLVRQLVSDPHTDIHIFVRKNSSLHRIHDLLPRITVHTVDLLQKDLLCQTAVDIAPTHVFHFANQGVYSGESVPEERFEEVNVTGFQYLLEALRDIPYEACINIGSSSEYGRKDTPMRESDTCEPVTPYGVSKLKATALAVNEALQYKKPIATFRIFSPYGPQDDPRRLIPVTIRSLKNQIPFTRPHPEAVRDYIFVDDIPSLLLEAAKTIQAHVGDVFNVGRGEELVTTEVVHTLARMLHQEVFLETFPETQVLPLVESPRWVADMNKTFSAFSWRPATTLEDGLKMTIEAYE